MIGTSGRRAFALGRSSRPLIPGMLMSERIKMSDTPAASVMRWSATGADCANSIVNRPLRRSRRNCWRNSVSTSGSSSTTRMSRLMLLLLPSSFVGRRCRTRQNDPKFGELAGPRIDLYRPRMLLDDDVVTDGKTEPSTFPGRLGRKERVEQLFLNL